MNNHIASFVAVDSQGSRLTVERQDGRREMPDLAHLADRHIRAGWVRTIHSAQGATAERVMAHLESFRAIIVDDCIAYVAVSRAKKFAAIYTDDRLALVDATEGRSSAKVGAIDETLVRKGTAIAGKADCFPPAVRTWIKTFLDRGWLEELPKKSGCVTRRFIVNFSANESGTHPLSKAAETPRDTERQNPNKPKTNKSGQNTEPFGPVLSNDMSHAEVLAAHRAFQTDCQAASS